MDKAKEHNRLDKMIARTKELQKEIDHRHEVEEKVFELFSEGKFEEGDALLATLDDDKARALMEEERQEAFSHKNVEITKRYIGVKKTEDYADVISNDEMKAIEKAVQEEPEHEFSKNDEQTLIEYIAGAGKSCSKEEEIKRAETLGRLFAVLRQPEDLYALRFALSNLISSIQVGSSFQLVVNYDKDLKKLKINYSHKPENFLK